MKTELIIDVREDDEYAAEYISGSHNFPLSKLDSCLSEIKRHGDGNKLIIVCKSGKRAQMAHDKIKRSHREIELEVFEGGIEGWKKLGKETNVIKKFHLPIMRQVQIIAGGLVFIFSVATLITGNINLVAIPAFVGAGLTFAGVSGWCGLAKALSFLPWNK